MERLTKIYQKGRISEEAYDREYAALEARLAVAEASIEQIGSAEDPLGVLAAQHMLERFEEALAGGSAEALQEVASQLIERVVVKDSVVIECMFIPPLERLRRAALASSGHADVNH